MGGQATRALCMTAPDTTAATGRATTPLTTYAGVPLDALVAYERAALHLLHDPETLAAATPSSAVARDAAQPHRVDEAGGAASPPCPPLLRIALEGHHSITHRDAQAPRGYQDGVPVLLQELAWAWRANTASTATAAATGAQRPPLVLRAEQVTAWGTRTAQLLREFVSSRQYERALLRAVTKRAAASPSTPPFGAPSASGAPQPAVFGELFESFAALSRTLPGSQVASAASNAARTSATAQGPTLTPSLWCAVLCRFLRALPTPLMPALCSRRLEPVVGGGGTAATDPNTAVLPIVAESFRVVSPVDYATWCFVMELVHEHRAELTGDEVEAIAGSVVREDGLPRMARAMAHACKPELRMFWPVVAAPAATTAAAKTMGGVPPLSSPPAPSRPMQHVETESSSSSSSSNSGDGFPSLRPSPAPRTATAAAASSAPLRAMLSRPGMAPPSTDEDSTSSSSSSSSGVNCRVGEGGAGGVPSATPGRPPPEVHLAEAKRSAAPTALRMHVQDTSSSSEGSEGSADAPPVTALRRTHAAEARPRTASATADAAAVPGPTPLPPEPSAACATGAVRLPTAASPAAVAASPATAATSSTPANQAAMDPPRGAPPAAPSAATPLHALVREAPLSPTSLAHAHEKVRRSSRGSSSSIGSLAAPTSGPPPAQSTPLQVRQPVSGVGTDLRQPRVSSSESPSLAGISPVRHSTESLASDRRRIAQRVGKALLSMSGEDDDGDDDKAVTAASPSNPSLLAGPSLSKIASVVHSSAVGAAAQSEVEGLRRALHAIGGGAASLTATVASSSSLKGNGADVKAQAGLVGGVGGGSDSDASLAPITRPPTSPVEQGAAAAGAQRPTAAAAYGAQTAHPRLTALLRAKQRFLAAPEPPASSRADHQRVTSGSAVQTEPQRSAPAQLAAAAPPAGTCASVEERLRTVLACARDVGFSSAESLLLSLNAVQRPATAEVTLVQDAPHRDADTTAIAAPAAAPFVLHTAALPRQYPPSPMSASASIDPRDGAAASVRGPGSPQAPQRERKHTAIFVPARALAEASAAPSRSSSSTSRDEGDVQGQRGAAASRTTRDFATPLEPNLIIGRAGVKAAGPASLTTPPPTSSLATATSAGLGGSAAGAMELELQKLRELVLTLESQQFVHLQQSAAQTSDLTAKYTELQLEQREQEQQLRLARARLRDVSGEVAGLRNDRGHLQVQLAASREEGARLRDALLFNTSRV